MSNVAIRGLVKRYGNVTAVDGIDLEIAEGEFVVLLGPSGCGKTTTLRCIAGLEDVSGGTISMGDQVVSAPDRAVPPEKRGIGMVFQSYAIWPHMSVAQNIAFGLELKKLPGAEVTARVDRTLELVGLAGYGARSVSQLSGGQQQRVALARAVVLEPRVLLFDEPLSNLDAKLRERMRFELRQLQKRLGITSIYVTHDQQEAMVIADRIVLMNQGRIDQIGSPVEIYRRPQSTFGAEFIGLANRFSGEVTGTDGGTRVRLAGGIEIRSDDTGHAPGAKVDVVFRPENLHVSVTPREGVNTWRGTAAHSFFLGNIGDTYIQVGELSLRAQLSPPQLYSDAQELWVEVPSATVMVFRSE
jgi:ABC-type Fe3+/spermidine/putrescine transport system ATPase subunit